MDQQTDSLQDSIVKQRQALAEILAAPLMAAAKASGEVWYDRFKMNTALAGVLKQMPYCTFLYALDTDGIQISDNVGHNGTVLDYYGRNRSECRFMKDALPSSDFILSGAYISLLERCPTLTAVQIVRNDDDKVIGFVGADFDLRALPLTSGICDETYGWKQLKGDPSIRSGVFNQTRVESLMDNHIDIVLNVMEQLVLEHGLYNVNLHFSSNRAVIWVFDDPYRYHVLDIYQLIEPDICLLYPFRKYSEYAALPPNMVSHVFQAFKNLRYMDDTLYLRSGGVNTYNGVVTLTFSCDGSHYIPYSELLNQDGSMKDRYPFAMKN